MHTFFWRAKVLHSALTKSIFSPPPPPPPPQEPTLCSKFSTMEMEKVVRREKVDTGCSSKCSDAGAALT